MGGEATPAAWSAVDDSHVSFVVVVAGGRREVVQPLDLLGAQLDASAAMFSSTRDTRLVPGIGAMSSPWARSQARATCAGVATDLGGDGLDLVDDAQVALEVFAGEARVGLAPVVVREVVGGADRRR